MNIQILDLNSLKYNKSYNDIDYPSYMDRIVHIWEYNIIEKIMDVLSATVD